MTTIHDRMTARRRRTTKRGEPVHDAPPTSTARVSPRRTRLVGRATQRPRGPRRRRSRTSAPDDAEDRVLPVGVDDHLRRDQPADRPQHRRGRRPKRRDRRSRIGTTTAWARPTPSAADRTHHDQAGGVGSIADDARADSETRPRARTPWPPIHRTRCPWRDPADERLDGAEHEPGRQAADDGGRRRRRRRRRRVGRRPRPPETR